MKRIGRFLRRALAVVVGLVALVLIVLLGINVRSGAKDLVDTIQLQAKHAQDSANFPAVASQIAVANATLAFERTHAPTDTITPTDVPDSPDTSGDNPDNSSSDNGGTIPTDVPQAFFKWQAQAGSPTATEAPPATNTPQQPPPTNTPHPTDTAVAATDTPYPTLGTVPPVRLLIPSTPSHAQPTGIPSPAPRVHAPAGNDILNIILTGTDTDVDPTDPSYRTDSMIVVSINRTTNTVAMLSLPRDLYVYIPTYGMQRLNVAFNVGSAEGYQPGGGFGLLQQTILYNFGIPVNFYARVSFNGFKQIVDTLSGVDVAVDCPVTDLRFQGPTDPAYTPQPSDYKPYTLDPGFYHMNGSLALWYARMRTASSDFDRSRRQQQVLRAIWQSAHAQGLINQAPNLWGQLTQIVQTNMTLPDVLGLVPFALNLSPTSITSYYMNKGYEVEHWTTPLHEDVQLPDPKGFFTTINRFYTPPTSNRLAQTKLSIAILNGSGHADWDKVAADRLSWAGFVGQAQGATDAAAQTAVYDYTGGAQPALLAALLKALNVKPSVVVSQPDPNRTTDFKVVLGTNYNTCSAPGYNTQ